MQEATLPERLEVVPGRSPGASPQNRCAFGHRRTPWSAPERRSLATTAAPFCDPERWSVGEVDAAAAVLPGVESRPQCVDQRGRCPRRVSGLHAVTGAVLLAALASGLDVVGDRRLRLDERPAGEVGAEATGLDRHGGDADRGDLPAQ